MSTFTKYREATDGNKTQFRRLVSMGRAVLEANKPGSYSQRDALAQMGVALGNNR